METYKIEVQEVLSEIIEIEAISLIDAIEKVEQLYKNEDIVLDHNNHISTDFILNNVNRIL